MSNSPSANEAQADFWTMAGPTWIARRDGFDRQAGSHGVAAIDALAPSTGEHLADVGCGGGTSTLQLAERVGADGSVAGHDISPTMVDGAQAFARSGDWPNVSFAVTDAMTDPIGTHLDGVYSRFGVMFFADATAGFANIGRALRPGGRLGFVCWQPPTSNPWAAVPLSIVSQYVDMPFGVDPTAPGPFSLADPDRIRSVLTAAGFGDVDITPREDHAHLGADVSAAVDFLFDLMPAAKALAARDADAADRLRGDLGSTFDDWMGDEGVSTPSASWIVTAVRND